MGEEREMAGGRVRAKRVYDLLDDKAKARLRGDDCRLAGYVSSSSGSEHEGGELSGFVDGFFFSDGEDSSGKEASKAEDAVAGSNGVGDCSLQPTVPVVAMVCDLLKDSASDGFRRDLLVDVTETAKKFAALRSNRSAFRRAVMNSLREAGYNAGICKARWESHGGVTAGSYEYIDVVRESPATPPPPQTEQRKQVEQRYIVDVEFAGEFKIARPTPDYLRIEAELPQVYVGKSEELKRLLRLLADAGKRSLRAREMHVPPWRKSRYVQAKWLGPYRRTLNLAPTSSAVTAASSPPLFGPGRNAECRLLGFHISAAPRVIPPAAN